MENWSGKVVIVTGAASGIGKGIAQLFIEKGANVIIADVQEEALQIVEQQLNDLGSGNKINSKVVDITNDKHVKKLIDETFQTFGTIHVIINSAGLQYVSAIEDFPNEMFEKLWKVMCYGPFLTLKYAFPIMKQKRFGRIINIASINGIVGFAGKSAYNSAKHAVVGLTKVAALEGAPYGITVNALCPGYVDTPLVNNQLEDLAKTYHTKKDHVLKEVIFPLVPQKRLLSVREVAQYALFLAAEETKGVTGQAVVIDGGYTVQ